MKILGSHRWLHLAALLLWIGIGTAIRLTGLDTKPPWTDEFATLVFSLGHSFETVPLDQVISLDALLQPLQLQPQTTAQEAARQLLAADVHPPLYFVLAHAWMRWLSPASGLASIALARSLPVLLGVLSIPAIFGLGCLIGRGQRQMAIGHGAAALMAVSPYGVYLAQEARHYTLAILWVIASLACLVEVGRYLRAHTPPPLWLCGVWVMVNGLGIATHYFLGLTLAAIALSLAGLALEQARPDPKILLRSAWQRLYGVMVGTVATALVWFPVWQTLHRQDITAWIQTGDRFSLLALIKPLAQSIAAWTTMLMLLPVEADWLPFAVLSGAMLLLFMALSIPALWRSLQQQSHSQIGAAIRLVSGFVVGAIALFFVITYGFGSDLTRGARYAFVYFPGVIALAGVSLAALWSMPKRGARVMAIAIWVMGLASGLTVAGNLGYQKYYRPDRLVPLMQQTPEPILIATTHNTLVQVGEMMGIGWEWQRHEESATHLAPQFLLAHQTDARCTANCSATTTLDRALTNLPRPFHLWVVNFHAPVDLEAQGCVADTGMRPSVYGYDARLYRCVNR